MEIDWNSIEMSRKEENTLKLQEDVLPSRVTNYHFTVILKYAFQTAAKLYSAIQTAIQTNSDNKVLIN